MPVLGVAVAEDFAARILEFIPAEDQLGARRHHHFDRRRVESDLAGLRAHQQVGTTERTACFTCGRWEWCDDAVRYSDGLLWAGRVYGVAP